MYNNKSKQNKQLNKYLRFSGVAFQMGVTIYLGSKLGQWLDFKYGEESGTYTKVITLLAVFISMYSVIRQAKKLSKDND